MTDRRGVIARRAEDLVPGVPYVRGWNLARRGAGTLADQLVLLGLDSDFPGLVANVNIFGDGLVELGTVRPEAAERLAKLITAGLQAELHSTNAETPALAQRQTPAA
ncbi:hypothetical protein GCM10018785_25170 [Streptomyces longispororuber]|uniref:Uncharacterized protein n=1 Tax=Streptomyces longispororuber TaxID=68230 RepID=A0A918ZIB1_9ACTN|nr:hypothetical protein [Streptomyces longispororuber]GHE54717.1 hypothetical protein GCM10018785_25170 [Streptomyces longispororuber]